MLIRSDSYHASAYNAALEVEQAHATPQSLKDFDSLRRPEGFTLCEQMELLHHAAALLREQGCIEELSKDETFLQREFIWVALYPHLRQAGYSVPERYSPSPSGRVVRGAPAGRYEQRIDYHCGIMPAICTKTGTRVVLKITCSRPGAPCAHELEILRLLNTEPLRSHPDNAAVRLIDVVPFPPVPGQPRAADLHVVVMPVLQELDLTHCVVNGYALDLLKQSFRTVAFLHSIGICHRDVGRRNFMVEPTKRGPYKLQLIDFGFSQQFDLSSGMPSVQWFAGQIPPPEVEEDHNAHYDPFKAEIFALSVSWRSQKLRGVLPPAAAALLAQMADSNPAARPSAVECVRDLQAALAGVGLIKQCGPTGFFAVRFRVAFLYPIEGDMRASCVKHAGAYVRAVGRYVAHREWRRLRQTATEI